MGAFGQICCQFVSFCFYLILKSTPLAPVKAVSVFTTDKELTANYLIDLSMEVITIEHETFKALIFEIEEATKLTKAMFDKMSEASQDRWLSPEEAAQYVGFKPAWVKARASKIGCFKDGCGLRFKRSDIDRYMKENSFRV